MFFQAIENYMFEDHLLIKRAAVQCWTNLCVSEIQVKYTIPISQSLYFVS
jgi:hypothetical protein